MQQAQAADKISRLSSVQPAAFVASGSAEVVWIRDLASLNYLGNEFLLWLWFILEEEGDLIDLADKSDVTVMLSRSLSVECPAGQSGSGTLRSEAPNKLPEARRAIQAGKLPRSVGLVLVRHEQQYELTLQAETLAVSGAKLPEIEESEDRARLEEGVGQVRAMVETVDLLYGAFLQRRLGGCTPDEKCESNVAATSAEELQKDRLQLRRARTGALP
jgi:hypothetical protein